ncbi:hypothetical protein [Pendulispora albinea]|uniref:ABC transporter substrate-binding protein n=1 Tax=Pendulispora albinea TaxID=2741071 RepID=A0ABZ2MAI2_9BACT
MSTMPRAGGRPMLHTSPRRPKPPVVVALLSLALSAFAASNTACTALLGKTTDQCSTNQDCTKFSGKRFCRRSDATCQPLVTPECPRVFGGTNDQGYLDDNAVYIGAVISLTGAYGDNGGYIPFEGAVRTALDDFDKESKGLPPAAGTNGRRRPLVAIMCDDKSAEDSDENRTVLRAADHLVNTVGVSAVIGTPSTSTTLAMATERTIPGGVFTISPSATAENLSLLQDYPAGDSPENGLLWRTAPSDRFQAAAIAAYLQQRLIPGLHKAPKNVPAGQVKILNLFRGDAYGEGLNAIFKATDAFNAIRGEQYREFNYGTTVGSPTPTDISAQIRDFAPHIILTFGLSESADTIKETERLWGELPSTRNQPRPYYVSTEGVAVQALPEIVKGSTVDPKLNTRALYASPNLTAVENEIFSFFRDSYNATMDRLYQPGQAADAKGKINYFGLAGTYDSVYILGYAITSASSGNRSGKVTGRDIAQAMKKLVNGDAAPLYRRQMGQALATLSNGGTVNISGASGPLDFDLKTGDVAADIPLACLTASGDSTSSALVYRVGTKNVDGTFDKDACGYTPPQP